MSDLSDLQQEVVAFRDKNKAAVSDELADVLYWVLLVAHDLDIDLSEAVSSKIEKNNKKYPVEKASGNHKKYTELG